MQDMKLMNTRLADQVQLFLHRDKLIEVSDKAIIVRGLDEYLLQLWSTTASLLPTRRLQIATK